MSFGHVLYYVMYAVGFAVMMLHTCLTHKKYGVSAKRSAIYTLVTYVMGVAGARLMGEVYSAALRSKTGNGTETVSIFGCIVFTPLLLLAVLYAENGVRALLRRRQAKRKKPVPMHKKQQKKQALQAEALSARYAPVNVGVVMDLLTPGIFIILACAKFGCFFNGCCFGVACGFGTYNAWLETTAFPVQLFECATTLLVVFVSWRLKKRPFYKTGMAFPLTSMLFCLGRFGWEYVRYYDPAMRNFALGLTFWQLFCIAVTVVSAALLAYMRFRKDPKGDTK